MFLSQVADFDFSPLSDKSLSAHSESGCGQVCCRSCFLRSSQEAARESHEFLLSFYKPVKMYTVWRTQLHFGYTNSKFNFLTCDELQAQCCMNGFFCQCYVVNYFAKSSTWVFHYIIWKRRSLKHSRSNFVLLNYMDVYIYSCKSSILFLWKIILCSLLNSLPLVISLFLLLYVSKKKMLKTNILLLCWKIPLEMQVIQKTVLKRNQLVLLGKGFNRSTSREPDYVIMLSFFLHLKRPLC